MQIARLHVDVLVVGSGVAGCVAATSLARAGWRVALSGQDAPFVETGETLAGATRPVLEHQGLWETFLASAPLAVRETRSNWTHWEWRSSGLTSAYGGGFLVDKESLVRGLRAEARRAGAIFVEGVLAPATLRQVPSGYSIRSADGAPDIEARALIDATGRSAAIARRLGAKRVVHNRLVAECRRLPADQVDAAPGLVHVHAGHGSWWYLASLPRGGFCLSEYFEPGARGRMRAGRTAGGILAEMGVRVGGDAAARPTKRLNAGSAELSHASGARWAAVGDAALAMDPLAASGLAFAFRSGHRAASAIAAGLLGDPRELEEYARMHKALAAAYGSERQQVYAQRVEPMASRARRPRGAD